MELIEKLEKEIIFNMKEKNKDVLTVLRMVKSDLQLENINNKTNTDDDLLLSVILRHIKSRNESITEFEKGNREDLINKTKEEIKILEEYLPKQLSKEEVNEKIEQLFDKLNPTSMKDMGLVMKEATEIFKGVADMKYVSSLIKDKLSK